MTTSLPVGVRVLDQLTRRNSQLSVATMTPERIVKLQQAVIPEGLATDLILGRPQKGVEIRSVGFPARHGNLPMRIYTPEAWSRTPRPVVLNLHGGGFVFGSARQCDWHCSLVAKELDAVVVSVDYRLAPAYRFPAGVEDCYDALLWTAAHAEELGGDVRRIGVMGDSAGGNLAAVVTLMARDEGGPGGPQIRHQALVYPATDLTDAVREDASALANVHPIVLSNDDIEVFRSHYVGPSDDPRDYRLSPTLAEDLSGLPSAIVVVAGLDPLHDSGVRYAQALADAGNQVQVEDFHLMPHGFLSFPYLCPGARPAVEAIVSSQRAALG